MKRKNRAFLIVSGIVSLASQLPSCKTDSNKSTSDVLADGSTNGSDLEPCVVNAKGGATTIAKSVRDACAAVRKWAADSDRFTAVGVDINTNGLIQITFATALDSANGERAMSLNLHFVKDDSGWWNYYVNPPSKDGNNSKGGVNDTNVGNRIVMFVQDNGKGGKGGN